MVRAAQPEAQLWIAGEWVKATVRGTTLDARPVSKTMTDPASPSQRDAKDFDLDMKVGTVTGANKQAIGGLELSLSRRGGDDRLAFLKGRLGQGWGSSRDATARGCFA